MPEKGACRFQGNLSFSLLTANKKYDTLDEQGNHSLKIKGKRGGRIENDACDTRTPSVPLPKPVDISAPFRPPVPAGGLPGAYARSFGMQRRFRAVWKRLFVYGKERAFVCSGRTAPPPPFPPAAGALFPLPSRRRTGAPYAGNTETHPHPARIRPDIAPGFLPDPFSRRQSGRDRGGRKRKKHPSALRDRS